jgi:hypothetical protein
MLALARAGEFAPIASSTYAHVVQGFERFSARRQGALSWLIETRGSLQTVRFDQADNVSLDLGASTGAMGARRYNGSLYVALDPGVSSPRVSLAREPGAAAVVAPNGRLSLHSARWAISHFVAQTCSTIFMAHGHGNGDIALTSSQGHYGLRVYAGGNIEKPIYWDTLISGADGLLTFSLPPALGTVRVTLTKAQCS